MFFPDRITQQINPNDKVLEGPGAKIHFIGHQGIAELKYHDSVEEEQFQI